jgi:hypothetical protein
MTFIRAHITARRALASLLLLPFFFKLILCLLFFPSCTFLWAGLRAVKHIAKFLVIVKVCAIVVARVWRGAAWLHNNICFAAVVAGLSLLAHIVFFA